MFSRFVTYIEKTKSLSSCFARLLPQKGADMKLVLFFLKIQLAVYAASTLLILLLAGIAYQMSWQDGAITAGVVFIYILTNFLGGFIVGKVREKRRFLWGALEGLLYFSVVSAVSFLLTGSFYGSAAAMIAAAAICVAGGMAGGMVSGV